MTAFYARLNGQTPRGRNIKDSQPRQPRPKNQDEQFETLGFERVDWNKWRYTWPGGEFPSFRLVPGNVDFRPGWVAICEDVDRQIPIGQATPKEIKNILDDQILEIMRYKASLVDEEIDFDQYIADLKYLGLVDAGIDEACKEAW